MQKHFYKLGISIFMLIGVSFTFSSCVKEYTCKCDISYSGKPGLPESFSREYQIKNTNTEAKNLCRGASATVTEMGITTTEECDLY